MHRDTAFRHFGPLAARGAPNCCSNDGTLLAQPSALAPSPHHATGSDAFPRLAQADVVSQIDVQLRQEMVEALSLIHI